MSMVFSRYGVGKESLVALAFAHKHKIAALPALDAVGRGHFVRGPSIWLKTAVSQGRAGLITFGAGLCLVAFISVSFVSTHVHSAMSWRLKQVHSADIFYFFSRFALSDEAFESCPTRS